MSPPVPATLASLAPTSRRKRCPSVPCCSWNPRLPRSQRNFCFALSEQGEIKTVLSEKVNCGTIDFKLCFSCAFEHRGITSDTVNSSSKEFKSVSMFVFPEWEVDGLAFKQARDPLFVFFSECERGHCNQFGSQGVMKALPEFEVIT